MTYCVIIGDIKSSKNLENRSFVQDKLNGALAQLNKSYKTDIAADFLITLGDEFQGVLTNSSVAMDIIQYIQRVMYPVELRFGVGFGDIVTKINRNAAIGADGPVFWAARNAINTIHEDETYYKKQAQDVMVAIYQSNNRRIHEINTCHRLL